jgi:hypothetical protein
MADAVYDTQLGSALTTTTGQGGWYFDITSGLFITKDAAAKYYGVTKNAAIAAQTVNAADTYLTDSDLLIPSFGAQARARFLWTVSASKTAAGTATPIYNIRIGAARTTGDTVRLALTGPAQTAIADIGTLYVMATIRNIGASGVLQASAWWVHRGTAASTTVSGVGFANDTTGHVEGTSAGFDNSALAGQYMGLSVNSGAAGVWTVTQVWAQADW